MIFEKIRERLQDVIDGIEVYTAGRLNTEKANISILQLQRFANELKKINQVEAEYNNGWIPCKVELPKETQKSYLIYYKRHGGLNGCYNLSFVSKDYFMSDKRWEIEDRFPDAKVTHWQPLPQPPKGE